MKKTTSQDIKNALWAAADTFRGKIDASNYKDYILSMLFVKYLSDMYKEDIQKLEEKYSGIMLERQKQYLQYVMPESATFDYLYKNRNASNIGDLISQALSSIEDSNITLQGIFRGIDFNSESNLGKKEEKNPLLRELLQDFVDLDLKPSSIECKEGQVPADIIGDAYEYMIGEFATSAGKKAGSFFTPQAVSEVMACIVNPQSNERVYDPTCGSGSLLIRAARKDKTNKVKIYGQEKTNSAVSMARMNMFLHGILDANIAWGDTLSNPLHLDKDSNLMQFECIVANMPFSLDKWAIGFNQGGEMDGEERQGKEVKFTMEASLDKYHRFDIGVPPASKGDWAFLLHMIYSMANNGRIAAVAPHGVLFRGASEGRIRQQVLDKNLIDAVIGLPENIFYGTSIPACILVFRKNKANNDVLFIDASSECEKQKAKNVLRQEDIDKIVKVYNAYRNGTYEELPQECKDKYSHIATYNEIQENDYNLNIPRYVDTFEAEEIIDIEKVNEEIKDLKSKISTIEEKMTAYLKELGIED